MHRLLVLYIMISDSITRRYIYPFPKISTHICLLSQMCEKPQYMQGDVKKGKNMHAENKRSDRCVQQTRMHDVNRSEIRSDATDAVMQGISLEMAWLLRRTARTVTDGVLSLCVYCINSCQLVVNHRSHNLFNCPIICAHSIFFNTSSQARALNF